MRRPVLIVSGIAATTLIAGIAVAASANAGTTTYEAEASGNKMNGGAHLLDCGRCSGGSGVTGIGGTGTLTFTKVAAEKAGPTRIAVTYAGSHRRAAQISVNGAAASAIDFGGTRHGRRTATAWITATLKAGDNTLTFGNPAGPAPDIDKLVIVTDGRPPRPTAVPTQSGSATPPATASPTRPTSRPPTSSSPTPTKPPTTSKPPATSKPPTSTPTKPPTTTPPAGNAALEAEVVRLVNVERAKVNCKSVTSDDRLVKAARAHSADMVARNYFSHDTPEGVQFATRISNAGYRWGGAAENIAAGQGTADSVMKSWMASDGHRANILACKYTDVGVGVVAKADGSLVWTQDFAHPL